MRVLALAFAAFALALTGPILASPALAQDQTTDYGQPSQYSDPVDTYSQEELADAVSDFFGVTAEAAASMLERVFSDLGRPVGYVAGEEASGAVGIGLRYGEGYLTMKTGEREKVYWRGPSVGWDIGGNASRVFVLVYNLDDVNLLFQRFPGVEGTAYLVAGMGVNYQRADDITLAPIRSGVGLRAGANVGYLAYTRRRAWLPF